MQHMLINKKIYRQDLHLEKLANSRQKHANSLIFLHGLYTSRLFHISYETTFLLWLWGSTLFWLLICVANIHCIIIHVHKSIGAPKHLYLFLMGYFTYIRCGTVSTYPELRVCSWPSPRRLLFWQEYDPDRAVHLPECSLPRVCRKTRDSFCFSQRYDLWSVKQWVSPT